MDKHTKLHAVLWENGITCLMLSGAVGITRQSVNSKINGLSDFKEKEMRDILAYLRARGLNYTAEELFNL